MLSLFKAVSLALAFLSSSAAAPTSVNVTHDLVIDSRAAGSYKNAAYFVNW